MIINHEFVYHEPTFRSLRREKIELRIHWTKQTKNPLMKSSQPQNLGVPA